MYAAVTVTYLIDAAGVDDAAVVRGGQRAVPHIRCI
jgi:hypothetical protein